MRIENKEFKIYTYDELTKKAKENVRLFLLSLRQPEFFVENVVNELTNGYGLINPHVEFSLSYSQGDGLNIYGDFCLYEIKDLLIALNEFDFTQKEWRTLEFYYDCILKDVEVPQNTTRYAYDFSSRIDIYNNWVWYLKRDRIRNINHNLILKFENIVKNAFSTLNSHYENEGYNYFYDISDDEIIELCCINQYEFLESGELW